MNDRDDPASEDEPTAGEWVRADVVGSDAEAALVVGMLDSYGIPARIESLAFHQEPVNFGRLGEVRIWVPASSEQEARRILAEHRARKDASPPGDG